MSNSLNLHSGVIERGCQKIEPRKKTCLDCSLTLIVAHKLMTFTFGSPPPNNGVLKDNLVVNRGAMSVSFSGAKQWRKNIRMLLQHSLVSATVPIFNRIRSVLCMKTASGQRRPLNKGLLEKCAKFVRFAIKKIKAY